MRDLATLAGGCFWCLEAVFEQVRGVDQVVSGFTGGTVPHPTYRQVCDGTTGHAEAIRIGFEPEAISYRELLELFFAFHDPTTVDRQGPDIGSQYRSAIFYHTAEQKRVAEEVIAELTAERVFEDPLVTELVPLGEFYPAEAYHQQYFRNNPWQPYCQAMVAPKVAKLRARYRERLKQD